MEEDKPTKEQFLLAIIGFVKSHSKEAKLQIEASRQRNENKGYIIDTINTLDCGWETGIKPANLNWVIVEYYKTEEEAMNGHKKWIEVIEKGEYEKINDLGVSEFLTKVKANL